MRQARCRTLSANRRERKRGTEESVGKTGCHDGMLRLVESVMDTKRLCRGLWASAAGALSVQA